MTRRDIIFIWFSVAITLTLVFCIAEGTSLGPGVLRAALAATGAVVGGLLVSALRTHGR